MPNLSWYAKAAMVKLGLVGTPGPCAQQAEVKVPLQAPRAMTATMEGYDPDEAFRAIALEPVQNPVHAALAEAMKSDGKVRIVEAQLYLGRLGQDQRRADPDALRETAVLVADFDPAPYKLTTIRGHEKVVEALRAAQEEIEKNHPARVLALEAERNRIERILREDDLFDGVTAMGPRLQYDPNQYTEYTPLYGGEYNRQLYIYDTLTMHARAFEAWNHNPIAKRIVNMLVQYTLGRRVKAVSKKDEVLKAWNAFARKNRIYAKLAKFWAREYLIFGELFLDKTKWVTIDPSSIWDIITDTSDVNDVFYYHQQYTSAYQMFSGIAVPGVPGSADTKPIEYIIRQIPADQVLHLKGECVSNEKRGRSKLFPILGWLKRIKDLYNAEVIGAWMRACFIWDDTIDGGPGDIQAHIAAYSNMPVAGTLFAHNKAIERKVLAPQSSGAGAGAGATVANEVLAFIATAIGIPKENFNIISASGGNRATALVGSEPFTKVIEELQAEMEDLLIRLAEIACTEAGVEYEEGDIEFIFPSVTKDTTSETMKNIALGQEMGWWSQETAAAMGAAEMNITSYDYDEEQEKLKAEREQKLVDAAGTLPPVNGGFGGVKGGGAPQDDGEQPESPIHGQGKVKLKKSMGAL